MAEVIDEDERRLVELDGRLVYQNYGKLSFADYRKPFFPDKFHSIFKDLKTGRKTPAEEVFDRYTQSTVTPKPIFPNDNKPIFASAKLGRSLPNDTKPYHTSLDKRHVLEAAKSVIDNWKAGKSNLN